MSVHYTDDQVTVHHGDALDVLRTMPDTSVDCIVTSPPYFGLRDYGEAGQYGLEASPAAYVETMRAVFGEARRVLAKDGTLWINLGDSYASTGGTSGVGPNAVVGSTLRQDVERTRPPSALPAKNLFGIPWRTAFALQDDGWILRSDIIWDKPNAMPESVTDRPSSSHEYVFLFARSPRYWFDLDAIREPYGVDSLERRRKYGRLVPGGYAPGDRNDADRGGPMGFAGCSPEHPLGRNPGNVWTIPTQPFPSAHFAVMPPALAERCVLAGCRPGGTVLDPFCGSGTTGLVALKHGRRFVGIDLSAKYLNLALRTRLAQGALIEDAS